MDAAIKEAGLTPEAAWKEWGMEDKFGPYGPDCWEKEFNQLDFIFGFEGFKPGEKNCYTIDSGHMSAGTVPGLEKVLGLPHIDKPDIEAVT